jgi:putative flippase GtrA
MQLSRILIFDSFTFFRFATVGATTAVIYFIVMWLADSIIGFRYIFSVSLAYFFSTCYHFLMNRHYTFGAVTETHGHQFRRYLVMWTINYLATIFIVGFSVEKFALSPYFGVCVSIVFTTVVGYVLSRYWIFRVRG